MTGMRKKGIIGMISVMVMAAVFTGCSGEEAGFKKTCLRIPEENFIVTDLAYERERGLQISGFTKTEARKIAVSVWNYRDDEAWGRAFEKSFTCEEGKEIEGQIYWSSGRGFVIPYAWELDNDENSKLEEEYYYINREGELKKLPPREFSGISNLIFAGEDWAYWKDFMEFSLKRWNCGSEAAPEKVELSGVKKVSRMACAGDYLYLVGFDGNAALYDVKEEREITGSENLAMMAEALFDTGLAGNDFAFAPYIDENGKETLYYIDRTGLWKYQNGEKSRLIDGILEGFGRDTCFTAMAVKDEKTIFVTLFKSEEGIIKEETCRYDFAR